MILAFIAGLLVGAVATALAIALVRPARPYGGRGGLGALWPDSAALDPWTADREALAAWLRARR